MHVYIGKKLMRLDVCENGCWVKKRTVTRAVFSALIGYTL